MTILAGCWLMSEGGEGVEAVTREDWLLTLPLSENCHTMRVGQLRRMSATTDD